MQMCETKNPCYFLFIEDDPGLRRMVTQMADLLLEDGMVFDLAPTLEDGLARLADPKSPDYESILLDLNLPSSQGKATFDAVNDAAPDTDIIVYTGDADRQLVDLILHSGAERVMLKGQWTFAQVATVLHYSAGRNRVLRRERKRCEEVEAIAARLQTVVDDLANPDIDSEVIRRVDKRVRQVRDEVKAIAA